MRFLWTCSFWRNTHQRKALQLYGSRKTERTTIFGIKHISCQVCGHFQEVSGNMSRECHIITMHAIDKQKMVTTFGVLCRQQALVLSRESPSGSLATSVPLAKTNPTGIPVRLTLCQCMGITYMCCCLLQILWSCTCALYTGAFACREAATEMQAT